MNEFFFRNDLITQDQTLHTAGCVAIGIANYNAGNTKTSIVRLNEFPIYGVPETARGTNANNNIIWFPINGGERDATLYKLRFDKTLAQDLRQVWVWYKVIKKA